MIKRNKKIEKKVINKINIQEFSKEWINKLKNKPNFLQALINLNKESKILSKEYTNELEQLYSDPIEDVRVANEYNKLKSQIQNRKTNGR